MRTLVLTTSLCALLLGACSVQVGSASFKSDRKWVTNEGDGRLVLNPDDSSPTTGRWSLSVKDGRNRRDAGIVSQSMVIVSPTLGSRHWPELTRSRLYDPSFTHRFRRASAPGTPAPEAP